MVKWGREIIFLHIESNWYLKIINIYVSIKKPSLETVAVESGFFLSYFELFLQWWQIERIVTESKLLLLLLFPFPLLAFYCPTKNATKHFLAAFIYTKSLLLMQQLLTKHLFICYLSSLQLWYQRTFLSLILFWFFSPSRRGWVHFSWFFLSCSSSFKWLSSCSHTSECLATLESHIFTDSTHKSSSNSAAKLLWIH